MHSFKQQPLDALRDLNSRKSKKRWLLRTPIRMSPENIDSKRPHRHPSKPTLFSWAVLVWTSERKTRGRRNGWKRNEHTRERTQTDPVNHQQK
jgi:hypothetical protein